MVERFDVYLVNLDLAPVKGRQKYTPVRRHLARRDEPQYPDRHHRSAFSRLGKIPDAH